MTNPGYYPYDKCQRPSCGHLGASHAADGECLALVPGGRKRGMVQCRCRAFIPETGRAEGIFQINRAL